MRQIFLCLLLVVGCDEPVPEERVLSLEPAGRPPQPHPLINYSTVDIGDISIDITNISITIGGGCECHGSLGCASSSDQVRSYCDGCFCVDEPCGTNLRNCDFNASCETDITTSFSNCGGCTTPTANFSCQTGDLCCNGCVAHTAAHCSSCLDVCSDLNKPTCVTGTSYGCCPSSNLYCNGFCVDKMADPNCGSCGVNCGAAGKLCCGGACVDPKVNPNCGACQVSCSGTDTCSVYSTSGKCCPSGQINCSGACQAPNGDCGCTSCSAGDTCCAAQCVNTASDANNCGGCAMICSSNNIDTMLPLCTSGQCTGTCLTGYADCQNDKRNTGCQTDIRVDLGNCGGCGHICTVPTNGVATCTMGMCGVVCDPGYRACNGGCIPDAGCCLDSECTMPPNECSVRVGSCIANICTYRTIICPTVDCKNPPTCSQGQCVYSSLPAGTDCGLTGCFTPGEAGMPKCELDGGGNIYCNGIPKDCTAFDSDCTTGVCDSTTGTCGAIPKNENLACTSDACQLSPVCIGGRCMGAPKDCPVPPTCHVGYCDRVTGDCKSDRFSPQGLPCQIDDCHYDGMCDGNGSCMGTVKQDGTPCAAPASCAGSAICLSGACTCQADTDAGVPLDAPDLGPTGGKPIGCNGCVAAAAPPTGGWLLVMSCVVLWRLLRRRRSQHRP